MINLKSKFLDHFDIARCYCIFHHKLPTKRAMFHNRFLILFSCFSMGVMLVTACNSAPEKTPDTTQAEVESTPAFHIPTGPGTGMQKWTDPNPVADSWSKENEKVILA